MTTERIKKRIRRLLIFFSAALIFSGITAIPVKWELELLLGMRYYLPNELGTYLYSIQQSVNATSAAYPEIFYGFDWLAFAHIIIGLFFIGPIRDPEKNIWVIECGMLACLLVFPLAFICGEFRGIPLFWRCIDCSFGVFGFIPLYYARKYTLLLSEKTQTIYSTHQTESE
jgi:hypothetical protein